MIPTRNIREADLTALPVGERAILELVALRLLCAVAQPYTFAETAVVVECDGAEFTAKGRTVKQPGWRALDAAYRASMKSAPEQDGIPKIRRCRNWPKARNCRSPVPPLRRARLPRPNTSPRTHCSPRWKLPGKTICRRMPSAKGWGRLPPVPGFWKSWCHRLSGTQKE